MAKAFKKGREKAMKMTVKEFVKLWEDGTHNDVDVYDNVCEELGIAFCGSVKLTSEGKKEFSDVLEYEIDVDEDECYAIIDIDDEEGIWQKKLKRAKQFFYSVAGYCNDENYNKWFKEVA